MEQTKPGVFYLINQTLGGRLVRALRARAGILLLINQPNFPPRVWELIGLRAYRPRFGGNRASKYTKNHLFHCCILTILQRLVIIKILQGRSSLASLSIASKNNLVAISYKILDIGSRSHLFYRNFVAILPYCHTLRTSLHLIISKIL